LAGKTGARSKTAAREAESWRAKWLAKSCAWMKITQMTCKSQFDAMNDRSNGKSRFRSVPAFHIPTRRGALDRPAEEEEGNPSFCLKDAGTPEKM